MSGANSTPQGVLEMCDAIDAQYILEVGPFGQVLAEDVRQRWLASGNKVNATHAFEYMKLLGRQIPNAAKREAFLSRAMHCIKS
jgi:hypothetical protein